MFGCISYFYILIIYISYFLYLFNMTKGTNFRDSCLQQGFYHMIQELQSQPSLWRVQNTNDADVSHQLHGLLNPP